MAYQVLARRCRPQSFDEVVGQAHVTRTLSNALREGRIAHAFLLTGERGVGKTSVARILAKALNCHEGRSHQPCGRCPSCREIAQGTSLDVHEIDGASNNSVEDIRTLRENVKYRPARDRSKVYIIDEVHMLSGSAFNALLKTLEEPPEHVVFIFATTEPHKIPDTIISRCLRFDFKRIPVRDIAAHLEAIAQHENLSISSRGLFLLAREAEGSMRDAQTLLERAIAYCGGALTDDVLEELLGHIDRQILHRILEAVLSGDARGAIEGLAAAFDAGADLIQLYYDLVSLVRDVLMLCVVGAPERLLDVSDDELEALRQFAGRSTPQQQLACLRLCLAAEQDIMHSRSPRIALETCLLELTYCRQAFPIDDVLERLASLARVAAVTPKRDAPVAAKQQQDRPPVQKERSGPPAFAPASNERDLRGLLEHIKTKSVPAASKLVQAALAWKADNALTITFPAESIFIEHFREPEAMRQLLAWCKDYFGRDVTVSVVASPEKKKPLEPDHGNQQKHAREQQAMRNPVVQKILETFNGKIVEIRTDI